MAKPSNYVIIGLVVLGIFGLFLYYKGKDGGISNHRGFTTGKVLKTEALKGGGTEDFTYEYYVEGKRYTNSTSFGGLCVDLVRAVQDRILPVIYDGQHPENSRLLLTEKSFERFDLRLPDSLRTLNSLCE